MKKRLTLRHILFSTIVTAGVTTSALAIASISNNNSFKNSSRQSQIMSANQQATLEQPTIGKVCKGSKTLNFYQHKNELSENNYGTLWVPKCDMEAGSSSVWNEPSLNTDGCQIALSTSGMYDQGRDEDRLLYQQFYFPVTLPAHTPAFKIDLDMNTTTTARMNGHFLGQCFHSTAELFNFGTDSTLEPIAYTSYYTFDGEYRNMRDRDAYCDAVNTFAYSGISWSDVTSSKYDSMKTSFILENNSDQAITQNCYFGLSFFIMGESDASGSNGGEFIADYKIAHSYIEDFNDVTNQVKFEIDSIHNQYLNCDGDKEKEMSYFDTKYNTFYADSFNSKYESTRQFTDQNYWTQPQINGNIIETSQLNEADECRRGIWITQKATVTLPAKTQNTYYLQENIKAKGIINKCLKGTMEGPGDNVVMEYGIVSDISTDKKPIDIKANTKEKFNVWFDYEQRDVEDVQRKFDYGYTGSCAQYHFSCKNNGIIDINYKNSKIPFITLKNETDAPIEQSFYFTTFLSSWHVQHNSILEFGLSACGDHQIQNASFTTTVRCDSKSAA